MRAQSTDPSYCSPLNRLRRRLAAEQGMSLILVLGFLVIFTISTAAIVNELVLNETGAHRDQAMITALGAAEAELNFAQQWVAATDPFDTQAPDTAYPASGSPPAGSVYPLSTDTSDYSALATGDSPTSSTLYYTGNAVAGATNYGWWAHKYDVATCNTLTNDTNNSSFQCWLVQGRAKVGTSTREVSVILNGNSNEFKTQVFEDPSVVIQDYSKTGTETTLTTVTTPTYTNDYGSWGYGTFSSGASGGCYTMSGNASIAEPVYTPGSLCMGGNAEIIQNTAGNVTLFVKGSLQITGNNPHAGTSAAKLSQATIGSCTAGGSAVICSSSGSSHVYAVTYSSSGSAINKPAVNISSLYTSADPGPMHPCTVAAGSTASSTWPTFDSNTTRDNGLGNTSSPWGSTSYTCKTATGGSISWNASTHIFNITGTVFIDGNLSLSTETVIYQGRGNIYYNGTVNMSGNSYICPNSGCPTTTGAWNMATNLLVIGALNGGVVPNPCGTAKWSMSGNSIFQGAAYVNGCVSETGNGGLEGPATADGYTISGNGNFYQPLGTNSLPPGAPANSISTNTVTAVTTTITYPTTGTTTYTTTSTSTKQSGYWGQVSKSWRQLK